jgi:hypothetical protein
VNPSKLAAIKALAEDPRGDPNTRAIAKRKLEQYQGDTLDDKFAEALNYLGNRYQQTDERLRAQNQPNPRLAKSAEYQKYLFMNMENWKRGEKGHYTIYVGSFRITLFQHKKDHPWGWVRADMFGPGGPVYSKKRFPKLSDAQKDAWLWMPT